MMSINGQPCQLNHYKGQPFQVKKNEIMQGATVYGPLLLFQLYFGQDPDSSGSKTATTSRSGSMDSCRVPPIPVRRDVARSDCEVISLRQYTENPSSKPRQFVFETEAYLSEKCTDDLSYYVAVRGERLPPQRLHFSLQWDIKRSSSTFIPWPVWSVTWE